MPRYLRRAKARCASASAPSAPPAEPDPAAEPSLLSADGTPLPQTEERPSVTSERFKRRMQLLADAILTGDAEKAKATFFPLVAYTQVKDVQKPERDYRFRLLAHFERDVRKYHKALGPNAAGAYELAVPAGSQEAALDALRGKPGVMVAESLEAGGKP